MAFKPMVMTKVPSSPSVRPMINVNPLMDVMTGTYLEGTHGESILNGGFMNIVGVGGEGNTFKSTLVNSIIVQTLARHPSSTADVYITEGNFQLKRMVDLAKPYNLSPDVWDTDENSRFKLTSKSEILGDLWYDNVKELAKVRQSAKELKGTTPFRDIKIREKIEPVKAIYPHLHFIDSLSNFTTSKSQDKMDDNSIDDKELNTYYMADGLEKTKMMDDMPYTLSKGGQYCFITAHIADKVNMGVTPERKRLVYMRQGQKLKKVPNNFEFLTQHCWEVLSAKPLMNSSKDAPLYPHTGSKDGAKNDMLLVTIHGLRNKSGLSGVPFSFVISQSEGVLWDLSNYYFLTSNDTGVIKAGNNYKLAFMPDRLLTRTTIRDTLEEERDLARLVELTAEIAMLYQTSSSLQEKYRIPFDRLYDTIKEKYDWDVLAQTRGYWLFKEEEDDIKATTGKPPLPYLSGMDILKMANDEYIPWWYADYRKLLEKKD